MRNERANHLRRLGIEDIQYKTQTHSPESITITHCEVADPGFPVGGAWTS